MHNFNINLKGQSGITLMVLVITIIIMLILARSKYYQFNKWRWWYIRTIKSSKRRIRDCRCFKICKRRNYRKTICKWFYRNNKRPIKEYIR